MIELDLHDAEDRCGERHAKPENHRVQRQSSFVGRQRTSDRPMFISRPSRRSCVTFPYNFYAMPRREAVTWSKSTRGLPVPGPARVAVSRSRTCLWMCAICTVRIVRRPMIVTSMPASISGNKALSNYRRQDASSLRMEVCVSLRSQKLRPQGRSD